MKDHHLAMKVSAVLFCVLLLCQCAHKKELRAFTTDGCSFLPERSFSGDVDWRDCCVEHDFAYWKGGTEAERLAADERFRECLLKKTGDPKFAKLVFNGVRIGGAPYYPNWYRWGYGWTYLRPAGPFTEEEQAMISGFDAELDRLGAFTRPCPEVAVSDPPDGARRKPSRANK
jgi:hypothetical protein